MRGAAGQAYLLLVVTTLSWGGNAVVSRAAVGEISPMLLTAGRWALVLAILAVFAGRTVLSHGAELRARWRSILALGALGFTAFNALMYGAGHLTSAVNIALLQGAIPIFVIAGAAMFQGADIRRGQVLGLVTTLAGVALVATQGDPAQLLRFRFNPGDLLMLVACILYAGYTLALRGQPPGGGLWFFAGLAAGAFVTSIPLAAVEAGLGRSLGPTPTGWAILAFVALGPSFLAQVFYMRAIGLIGAARAGLFINLVPVFGALLAVALLGEPFHAYHVLALSLVLAGVLASEASARAGRTDGEPPPR
ncbi:MAG: hypothetical protein ABS78_17315 [Phenylobacterium sp. SCN 70-31]|nr:MAG: hypothetical protein ABS78_17315 [Phenylobacterium sp. SCN 70-31]